MGAEATRSAVALIGLFLGEVFLRPVGNEAPPQPVQPPLAGFGMLADDPVLLSRRAVVAWRHVCGVQRLDQVGDPQAQDLGVALLGNAAAHVATL